MSRPVIEVGEGMEIPLTEIGWQFTRASGPGGQNVNKTATRVELVFDVQNTRCLDEAQKRRVRARLGRLIDGSGVLHVSSQARASQWQNREEALARFTELMSYALRPAHIRVRTRPSRAEKLKRREGKARESQKRRRRAVPHVDDW